MRGPWRCEAEVCVGRVCVCVGGGEAPSAAGRAKAGFLCRESFLRAPTALQGRKRVEQKAVGRVSSEGASAAWWRLGGLWGNRPLAAGVRTQAAAPRLVRQRWWT